MLFHLLCSLGFVVISAGKDLDLANKWSSAVADQFASTGDPTLVVDSSSYKELILGKPKQFDLFVIYTSPAAFCNICKPFTDAFAKTGESYFHAGRSSVDGQDRPVFFAIVDISRNQDIAKLLQMTTLPHIVRYDGKQYEAKKKGDGFTLPNRAYAITKLNVKAQELLDWVNQEVGGEAVKLYVGSLEKIANLLTVVAVIVSVLFFAFKLILVCRRNYHYIVGIALLIYYISTSGLFYNILQGMQWVGKDNQGNTAFFMGTVRGQFLAEGLTMSGLTLLSGMSLFGASRLPFTERGRKMDPNKLAYYLIGLILVSTACMYIVIYSYVFKTGWYSSSDFAPPAHYRRGPLRVDQGNTY